ncbi:MAG: hypothetical protein A2Y76_10340 [Planctomycetes bacterium RBG_13_60_9]|nr:MAG: hypothetical protein A2Y76_10340 [Planctomycetes bacterium RBG_13_60_9]
MAWRRNGHVVGEPDYRIAFDNLRAEHAGPASPEPAARNVVHIENLDLIFERPSPACDEVRDHVRLGDFHDLLAPASIGCSPAGLLGMLDESTREPMDLAVAIDLTDTSEVRIRPMDWRVLQEDATVLRVHCTEARLRCETSEVVLQGRATVTTGHAMLEGGHLRMDVRNNRFLVDGLYLLTRPGDMQIGFGGCFDAGLNPVADAPASFVIHLATGEAQFATSLQPVDGANVSPADTVMIQPEEGSTENLDGFNNETSI